MTAGSLNHFGTDGAGVVVTAGGTGVSEARLVQSSYGGPGIVATRNNATTL